MRGFEDRRDAGRKLAAHFEQYIGRPDVIVLGLPRGGVPVAYEIATRLRAPMDVLVVRKIGVPGHEELAMGAIASGGSRVVNHEVVDGYGISAAAFSGVEAQERSELERREEAFRASHAPVEVAGKTVILVDDGVATGSTMAAALDALRASKPARIIAAVPVAPPDTCETLRSRADEMVCLLTPEQMIAIGHWYRNFDQTTDAEVRELLEAAARELPARTSKIETKSVTVHAGRVALAGELAVPPRATGIVVFAHGSGSSRLSPRNRAVADQLVRDGFATLLFDLLSHEEEIEERYTRHLRFDIPMLAERLVGAIDWVKRHSGLPALPIGLFGASTGAAAALIAATRTDVSAVVSRGGRPDLAAGALAKVRCPTLLIVGGDDAEVLELNRSALKQIAAPAGIHVVPGATHLFEEPGALEQVTQVASVWFARHLARLDRERKAAHAGASGR